MLTILTPTYNRLRTLPVLYDSLCAQTCLEFEWLVVDDGSTDGTAAWMQSCQARASAFPVRSLSQANGGKHVALNTGVRAARGNWVFIVDSDDYLTPDAVERVLDALKQASSAPRSVSGVCFRRADPEGRLLGLPCEGIPSPYVGTPSQVGRMVRGDLAYVFRRDVMAELPFPIIPDEKFVPELYIWNRIADRGPIWFYLDRAIYRCEYLDDGYTRNFHVHLRRNPGGFLLFYAAQIGREPRWTDRLKAGIRSVQCLAYCAAKAAAARRRSLP
ncbi:MAG: glycosyltransferase family 2 protein [Castellaniella sp.]|nr:glycosyltransferase family 2 protein [Castellaniella sp.]